MTKPLSIALLLVPLVMSLEPLMAICIKAERANLRHGPSPKHQKTWEVYRFMPFEKLSEKDGWLRIRDVDGDIHWVLKSMTTTGFECAVVKDKEAPVLSNPTVKAKPVSWSPVQKYYAFKVLKKQGPWVQVEDAAGSKGWVKNTRLWIN